MRVGLISDVHGNAPALSAVLAEIEKQKVDYLLFAGDVVGYYPYVNEVITRLRSEQITSILGNHDCYLLGKLEVTAERWNAYQLQYVNQVIEDENRAWLSTLPPWQNIEIDGLKFHLCHGSPWAVEEYIYPNSNSFERFAKLEVDVVVMAHTHIPLMRNEGNVLLLNPGSCGQPRDYHPGACYAILDTRERQTHFYRTTYDIPSLVKILETLRYPKGLINILRRTKEGKFK